MTACVETVTPSVSATQDVANTIAGIWSAILRKKDVGVKDEFFDIGGNSMLLIAMIEEVQVRFKKDISLEALAEGVTIEKIVNLMT